MQTDKTDVYYYFVRRAAELSRNGVGFILSRAFMEAFKASKLRDRILDLMDIDLLFDFRGYNVFEGVGIATAILIARKKFGNINGGPTDVVHFAVESDDFIIPSFESLNDVKTQTSFRVDLEDFGVGRGN